MHLVLVLSLGKSSAPQSCLPARRTREGPLRLLSTAPLAQALDGNLTVAQHTQLVLTLLQGLCSRDILRCNLAAELLLMIVEGWSVKPEQVGAACWPGSTRVCQGGHGVQGVGQPRACVEPREAVGPEAAPGHWWQTACLQLPETARPWVSAGLRPVMPRVPVEPDLSRS